MELIAVNKLTDNQAEATFSIAGSLRTYQFSYHDKDIFVAQFPEEMIRFLRLLPVPVTQSVVTKIADCLASTKQSLPFELELEKEILQLV